MDYAAHSQNHKAMKSAEAAGKRAAKKGDHAKAAASFGAAANFAREAAKTTALEPHKKVYEAIAQEHEARGAVHGAKAKASGVKAWADSKSGGGGEQDRDDEGRFA